MTRKTTKRQPSKVTGKTLISVYIPDQLLTDLRQRAADERRGLSASVQIALEAYLANSNQITAAALHAALAQEKTPTP